MANGDVEKLTKVLDAFEKAGKDKKEINAIRKLIENNKLQEALERIRALNNGTPASTKKRGRKKVKKVVVEEESEEESEDENEDVDDEYDEENDEDEEEIEEDNENPEEDDDEYSSYKDSYDDEEHDNNEEEPEEDGEKEDDDEEDDDIKSGWGDDDDDDEVVYKVEEKKHESVYPEKLRNEELEKTYVGLLLNNPKLIVKYYIINEECYFDDPSLLNIYKSILFTEGGKFTPEIAKQGFSFSVDNNETYRQKQELKYEISQKDANPEKVYLEFRKLCIIRKSYLEEPREDVQERIIDIVDYELYDQMSADEVKAAIVQVSVTQKFKQAILSEDLTEFLEKGENNLTNGLALPFPILSNVFKGIRKGETMAFAMPSNSGKSRFTIDISAYTAFIHRKKVLIISNEMSEEKMKLCLITTVINNPEIQKLHGQKLTKTEGELLEFKFRPDENANVKVDDDGFVLQEPKETRKHFIERLKKVSTEFNKTIAVTDWVNNQINNMIYFINITDHTNDVLQKVIMN